MDRYKPVNTQHSSYKIHSHISCAACKVEITNTDVSHLAAYPVAKVFWLPWNYKCNLFVNTYMALLLNMTMVHGHCIHVTKSHIYLISINLILPHKEDNP